MSAGVSLLLWGLVLLEAKHFVCDFVLQSAYQYRNKGIYGHPGGILHAGLHILGSLPALLLLTGSVALIAAILAAEFVVHYHLDWFKERTNKRYALTVDDAKYWMLFGADQLAHQLTYVVILAVLADAANF